MSGGIIQDIVYIAILIGIAIPLGIYIYKVMTGQLTWKPIAALERFTYKVMRIDPKEEQAAGKYALSVLAFSAFGFGILFLLNLLQEYLPLNPEGMAGMSADLAYNTTASFVSNTNWQAYSGESTLSYLTQMAGLTVQNVVSPAVATAVLFALIRGFRRKESPTVGNFWVDLVKASYYIMIPLAIIVTLLLISQGVVQNLSAYVHATTLESGAEQVIPMGPAASQIAIKQLGTNGGGFFGVNSAFPFENPTPFSNFVECLSLLLIPAALCFTFGRAVQDSKQGRAIFIVMLVIFLLALIGMTMSENMAAPQFDGVAVSGSMEGKETRFGVDTSALWATATTSASNGSVNSMHDSFTPLAGGIQMFLMMLGEVVFGGVGCGLYGMLAFAILTVFIAGLMVGRTPEYLGKKIQAFDMKMVCLIILTPPLCLLLGTAFSTFVPTITNDFTNTGAHAYSELLYAYTSGAGNNGSAFAGFNANTAYTNIAIGTIMLLVRFIPMIAVIFLSGNLAKKKMIPASGGTLSTSNAMFMVFLFLIVFIVGALTFLPALALGPIAEFFTTLPALG
ncbi:MAG: potassium-transporting ATPase subunit KdpA [Christensenella sp.]|nr:potassium-transporting ATPase subunit KdpA [Christensenella sp.]